MRCFLTDEREAGDKSLTRCPVKYNERMRPTATRGLSARFPLPAYCATWRKSFLHSSEWLRLREEFNT